MTENQPTSFAWGPFIAGCLVGGVLLPLITGGITLALLGTALSAGSVFSSLPGPFMLLRGLTRGVTTPVPSALPIESPLPLTNCGTDPQCMQDAIKACAPALSAIDSPQFSLAFKVLGTSLKTPGNCRISFEIDSVKEESLKMLGLAGQSMTCDVKPATLSTTSDILNAPDSDLNCDGALWGLFKIIRAGQSQTK